MSVIYFSNAIGILCVLISNTQGMHEGRYDNQETFAEDLASSFLYNRNVRQGRYSQDKGVRFGWQNPIRVAPTLRPPNSYPEIETATRTTLPGNSRDPWITSGSNQNSQYVKPPWSHNEKMPTAQPQTGRKCSKESRVDKQTGKCIVLGSSCGENMAFYEDPLARGFGECDCIQHANRPLVYLPKTNKCYFVFQRAFCKSNEWLTVDSRSNNHPYHRCSVNPCRQYVTFSKQPNWDWQSNDLNVLDRNGPVALFKEKTCSILGSSCSQPGKEQLANNIQPEFDPTTNVQLAFQGSDLVCRRTMEFDEFQNRNHVLTCIPGLINKWRLEGRCGAS